MRNKKFIIQLLVLMSIFSFANNVFGQKSMYQLSNFKLIDITTLSQEEYRKLNYSQNEFAVRVVDGKLEITKAVYQKKHELTILGGTLVGTNRGEWGGELTFEPERKELEQQLIKKGNIVSIFEFRHHIYFVEGLAHLSINEGVLYDVKYEYDKFVYNKLFDFEDAPEAITTTDSKILIAGHQNFYVIENEKKQVVFKDMFWRSLYPNSIAYFNDRQIYVGMRGGIAELDIEQKKVKFYRY